MPYRIFMTSALISEEALKLLQKYGCDYEIGNAGDTPEKIAKKLEIFQPEALIVNIEKITKNVLHASSSLKAIAKQGVGCDNIDIKTASALGIPVMITAYANYESVAEHTLALIFALLRKIPPQNIFTKNGGWDQKSYTGYELTNKTLGVVGFGRIGRRLVELVAPMKTNILIYDPFIKKEQIPDNVILLNTLGELLTESDIVSLHCPLTPETNRMIGEKEISLMKKESWIINTARGAIINESELIKALLNNKIAGAALDVFEKEPPESDNPLFKLDNVIVSNHIGGLSVRSFRNMGINAVENVLTILKGRVPDISCVINPEVFNKNI